LQRKIDWSEELSDASGVRRSRWLDRGQAVAVAAVAANVGLLARYWRGSPFEFVGAALPRAGRIGEDHALIETRGQLVVLGHLRAMVPRQVCLGVDVVHGQPMLRPDRAGQIHPQPPGLLRRQGGEMPLSDVRVGAADPVEAIEPGVARARRY